MNKKTLLRDGILIAVLLFVALVLLFVQRTKRESGNFAVVCVNGQEIGRYNLNKSGTYVLNDGTNTTKIEDGYVWMEKAECPNGLCISQGRIKNVDESIICLPNRLTVVIEGSGSSADFVL